MTQEKGQGFNVQAVSLFLSIGLIGGGLFWLSRALSISDLLRDDYEQDIERLFSCGIAYFHPEPLERLQFLTSLVLLPVLILLFQAGLFRLLKRFPLNRDAGDRLEGLLWISGALITAIMLAGIPFHAYLASTGPQQVLVFALCLTALYYLDRGLGPALKGYAGRAFDGLCLFLILFIPLTVVFDLRHVTYNPVFTNHFQSVFYPVVQVYLGKALLLDFFGQYGLFPHFLEPLFRLTGLSVLTFTGTMAVLLGASFLFLFLFLRRAVSNRVLAGLGFLAVLYFNYVIIPPVSRSDPDPYFQYFPVRYFFPTLFIWISMVFLERGGRGIYWLSHALFSLAVLWNTDTGIIVFTGWILVLLYQSWYENEFRVALREGIRHILSGVGVFLAVVLLLFAYLRVRYGQWPDLASVFQYQRIYYQYGFHMLPMPLWHPWNLVALTYATGLSYSIRCLLLREEGKGGKTVFMLSILGAGLFVYYQGRSHDLNLKPVLYPAVILWTILADRLYRFMTREGHTGGGLMGRAFFLGIILWVFTYPLMGLPGSLPRHLVAEGGVFSLMGQEKRDAGIPAQTSDFIRSLVAPGEGVLIMSGLSSIYYLGARAPDASGLGDHTVLVLRKDLNRLGEFIESGKGCDKIFVDSRLPEVFRALPLNLIIFKHYGLEAVSGNGIYYFRRKGAQGTEGTG